jgi:DNA-binding LytR/AlgR family response regulator
MANDVPTALIADDEPLLRQSLARMLQATWPELVIVADARNGREAVELFETSRPQVVFLDVQMPGMSGIDAARQIGARARIVFVTAFTDYAVQAFEHGALDYLVKPVEAARLQETVARLKERLGQPPIDLLTRIEELAARLDHRTTTAPLRWIRASLGATVHLVPVDQVDYLHSDEKYTVVAWRDPDTGPREALVRMPLRELVAKLDPGCFVQVHRSYAVNLASVSHVQRLDNETGLAHLRGRSEPIPVSRSCLHLFRQL